MNTQNNTSQANIQARKEEFDKAQQLLQKRLKVVRQIHQRIQDDTTKEDQNKD